MAYSANLRPLRAKPQRGAEIGFAVGRKFQEVVLGQTELADRALRIASVESVPLTSVEPDHAPRYESEVGPLD